MRGRPWTAAAPWALRIAPSPLADLREEQLPHWPSQPANGGPLVRDHSQLMQLITLGRTIAVLPASVQHHLRDDLTCVQLTDGPTSTLVIAWPEDSRSRPLAALVKAAVQTTSAV